MREPLVVIMAGGAGTRLWPVSTTERPKQLVPLRGQESLLQESYARARALASRGQIIVVTAENLVPAVLEQLPELPGENVVGEPMRRNTAAAVGLAMVMGRRRNSAAGAVVLTADHIIDPLEEFSRTITSALEGARDSGALYTIGIPPTYAATGYGYLHRGDRCAESGGIAHYAVRQFAEKPDKDRAKAYSEGGEHYWNSGMFVWAIDAFLAEMERQLPAHLEALAEAVTPAGSPAGQNALAKAYRRLETLSIDYGVMEKAEHVRMVVAGFRWIDVGGWRAVAQLLPEDERKNRHRGTLVAKDAADNLVYAEDPGELVALLGVEGLVVVRSGNRTLVMPRERAEDLKAMVEELEDDQFGRTT